MYCIQQLFIFYAISAYGFSLQDPTPLYNCLSDCSSDTCVDDCNDFSDELIYPQVDEDTHANVHLHCNGENIMMIKFNFGIYIIEQSLSDSVWSFAKVTKGNMATFSNLTAGTQYRYRFYNFTSKGISRPEVSDLFFTCKDNFEPLPVKNITVVSQTAEETNECVVRARLAFESAEDRSCYYHVLAWNGEHGLWSFNLEQPPEFQFELKHLNFEQSIEVSIASLNDHGTTSSRRTVMTFNTPTCLEYYNSLILCAPEHVTGLQAKHSFSSDNLYDLLVFWDQPSMEPDNYTLEIDLYGDQETLYTLSVPGNSTEVLIRNLELGPQYVISIVADSLGGTSIPERIVQNLTIEPATAVNKFYRELIIGITLSITIVVLVGMHCLQCYKKRSKTFLKESSPLENFNGKELSAECMKKLLSQSYDFDTAKPISLTLRHDKFNLCPKSLIIKGVIGSGAYGVVRLCTLRDKFDNLTDVAVKMLKDNPSMEDVQNFQTEIRIMKFVGEHPNIVSLLGCCNLYNKPVLMVEYCCKGDLQTYLRTIWQSMVTIASKHRARFKFDADSFGVNGIEYLSSNSGANDQNFWSTHIANRLYDVQEDMSQSTEIVTANDLLNFARQIATGMEFLSLNRIVHRDLAARNILVCRDRIVKISDFGLSRDVYQENLYRKRGNSKLPIKWMAIEALTHQIYTTQSDVWSFGILLWEIVTMGAIPYPGIPVDTFLNLLKSGYRIEKPLSSSIELYNIMFSCWNTQPQSRPTFIQLRESLDKLLSYESGIKYLNMDQILCEFQEQRHDIDE